MPKRVDRTVSARELRGSLGDLLDSVKKGGVIHLTHYNKPAAVLLSARGYAELALLAHVGRGYELTIADVLGERAAVVDGGG